MRSYIENHLGYFASPLKVFYWGPVFPRGDVPMTRQWGFKIIGDSDPIYDAEMITATLHFLTMLKIKQPIKLSQENPETAGISVDDLRMPSLAVPKRIESLSVLVKLPSSCWAKTNAAPVRQIHHKTKKIILYFN